MNATTTTDDLGEKLDKLRAVLRDMGSVLVCFSGGIDSAFLLLVANEVLGERALGITAVSPSLPPGEREASAEIARAVGARHAFIDSHEIDDPDYAANNPDRCFHCKTELYTLAERERKARGFGFVTSGIIVDDLGDYRPGIDAARENGVRFPLVEAGFRKPDIRAGAARLGLSVWNKPASACLSSRIPYGTSVTRERLARIGGLEAELKAMGFRQVRVRYHEAAAASAPATFARIELDPAEIPRAVELRVAIVAAGKKNGFQHVTLDLAGYRTGSANEVLDGKRLKIVGQLPTARNGRAAATRFRARSRRPRT